MGGSSGGGVKYRTKRTPEGEALFGLAMPWLEEMFAGGMPSMPSTDLFQIPGGMSPQSGWYEGLDPNVRAGIEEPYMRQMDMLEQRLGGRGMLGSARAGISGAGAGVMADYMGQAAPLMAQQGWDMMAGQRQAEMQKAIMPYNQAMQEYMMPYQFLPQLIQEGMPLLTGTPRAQSASGIQGALGGAATGAMIGSGIMPGVGTAIGAGLGGIAGLFT